MALVTARPAAALNSVNSSMMTLCRLSLRAPTFMTISTAVQPRLTASSVSKALTDAGAVPNGKAMPVPISMSSYPANSSFITGVQYALLE